MRSNKRPSLVGALAMLGACATADDVSGPEGDEIDVEYAQAQNVNLYTTYRAPADSWNADTVLRIDDDPDVPGFFWAMHGALENGDGWYLGLQENEARGKQAMFSIWNAIDTDCGSAAYSVDFGNEGVGKSCRQDFTYREGRRYRLRVWYLGQGWWGAWVIDEDLGVEHHIGSIRARSGAGYMGTSITDFTEYFGEDIPCAELPRAEARWFGLSVNGRSQLATRESLSVGSGCSAFNSAEPVQTVSSVHIMGD